MLTILLTDDDPDDHELFCEAISAIAPANCNIIHAYNGEEAMDYLLKHRAIAPSQAVLPDLIVLDLNMPLKDGLSTLKDIKSTDAFKPIPVYMLTTSSSEYDVKNCREMGCADYFIKPAKIGDLRSSIQKMILGVYSVDRSNLGSIVNDRS